MPTKASLTTRTAKGSALTTAEMDGNLENLRDASVGIASDDSTTVDLQLGNTLTVAGAGGASTAVSGQTVTVTQGTITITGDDSTGEALAGGEELKIAGSGVTTAVAGHVLTITNPVTASSSTTFTNKTLTDPIIAKVTTAANGDLELEPNGTGDVILDTDLVKVGGGSEVGHITSNSTQDLKLSTNSGTNSGTINITDAANGIIEVTANGTGHVVVGNGSEADFNSNISSNARYHHGAIRFANNAAYTVGNRVYANTDGMYQKLSSGQNSSSGDDRMRAHNPYARVDLNSSSMTNSSVGRGVHAMNAQTEIANTAASGVSTLGNSIAVYGSSYFYPEGNGGLTVTNARGIVGDVSLENDASGTLTVSNAYAVQANIEKFGGGGTETLTNATAFYASLGSSGAVSLKLLDTDTDTAESNVGTLFKYREKITALTDDSTADIHVDCSASPVSTFSLNDNKTFVFANLSAGMSHTLVITNQGSHTGAFQGSDSTVIKFAGGPPTVTTGAGAIDVVTVFFDGTNYIGNAAQDFKNS
jgi:hypothetical protein